MEQLQQCTKCMEFKNINEFSKNRSKLKGINTICKKCHSLYRHIHYINNKEKVLIQVKIYNSLTDYENIKNEVDKKLGRITNFSKKAGRIIERKCEKCDNIVFLTKKECMNNTKRYCSKECRNLNNDSVYKKYLKDIEKRSIKTKKDFNLDEEYIKNLLEVEQNFKCKLSNIEIHLKNRKIDKVTIYDTASLDRIDSSKGYTKDNVQWVALGINYMKLDYSEKEVHKLLNLIQQNYTPLA